MSGVKVADWYIKERAGRLADYYDPDNIREREWRGKLVLVKWFLRRQISRLEKLSKK